MSKTILVLKNEFITTVTRKSFIITLLIVPLVSGLVVLVISALGSSTAQVMAEVFGSQPKQVVEGFVDQSGIVNDLPPGIPPGRLISFSSDQQARQALEAGAISAYYVVPQDFIARGEVLYIRADYNPLSGMDQAEVFRRALRFNLLEGDEQLLKRLDQPFLLERTSLSPEPERDQNNMLTFFLPYIVTFLFYIVILTSAGYMLNSVTIEKQNRVLEILMVSLTPLQILTGKIIALGLVGLLQTLVWTGSGYALLRFSGQTFDLGAAFHLPISILAWGAVFFILGYAVYASLMAAIGALVPNLREASQATTIIILPMIIPLVLVSAIIEAPDGTLATALSLFPLTSPVTMMTRLAAGSVPIHQLTLSVILLILTALLIVRLVAGMFRAQTLLSGQPFSFKGFFRAMLGKAV